MILLLTGSGEFVEFPSSTPFKGFITVFFLFYVNVNDPVLLLLIGDYRDGADIFLLCYDFNSVIMLVF